MDRELFTFPEHMYLLRFWWSPCCRVAYLQSFLFTLIVCHSLFLYFGYLSVFLHWSHLDILCLYFIYYELANISKYIFYQTIIIMKISLKLQQVLLMLIKINSFLKFSFYVQGRCYRSKLDIEKVSRWDENSVILKQQLFVATLVILSRCCTNLLDVGVSYSLAIQHPEGLIDD